MSRPSRSATIKAVSEFEGITYDLPACGPDQTVSVRYGGTEVSMGDLNCYLNEGVLVVERNGIEIFTATAK